MFSLKKQGSWPQIRKKSAQGLGALAPWLGAFLLFLLSLGPITPCLAEGYNVGFRTLGFSVTQHGFRLDVNVWYPTTRKPRELNYVPWTIVAAREGKIAEGKFPLLLLSHPSPGTRFSYHNTCAYLATQGYIVACPTHQHDCMDDMQDLFTWEQLRSRVNDLKRLLNVLPAQKDLGPSIDPQKIGLIGFGTGGAAALLLGGAIPNCIMWPDYCPRAGKDDLYCNPWSREKMNDICQEFPLKKSLFEKRVKALAVISPGYGMLFSPQSFHHFNTPILVIAAEKDSLNRPALHADAITGYLREDARSVRLAGADLGALMAPCPESLARELSELCRSV
ncbi:MAG: hypothetical protein IJS50_04895, partial [Desulfovibrio sp.]|nr:hypothetical protein [Desulfovibrio sp.]